jgi:pimeloyl-ACP methyl ester carboxylesterase
MELNYKTIGEGPPLLILHGLFGALDNWITLGRSFGENYQTFLLDQRNHGKSPHTTTHGYPEMAEDLIGFMDQQDIAQAILIGHSMGGKTIMEAALRYPDRVSGLVIADMAPVQYESHHDSVFRALEAIDFTEIENRVQAERIMQLHLQEPGVIQFLLKNIDRSGDGKYSWKMNLPVLKREYDRILEEIPGGRKYIGPTLALRGGKSPYVQEHHLPYFRELFPELELETISDAGHWVHAEAPGLFYEIVLNFLQRISR